jgi:hypothetical protein
LFGSFLPSLFGWFGTTKVYSGLGADIVMESITLIENSLADTPPALLSQPGTPLDVRL